MKDPSISFNTPFQSGEGTCYPIYPENYYKTPYTKMFGGKKSKKMRGGNALESLDKFNMFGDDFKSTLNENFSQNNLGIPYATQAGGTTANSYYTDKLIGSYSPKNATSGGKRSRKSRQLGGYENVQQANMNPRAADGNLGRLNATTRGGGIHYRGADKADVPSNFSDGSVFHPQWNYTKGGSRRKQRGGNEIPIPGAIPMDVAANVPAGAQVQMGFGEHIMKASKDLGGSLLNDLGEGLSNNLVGGRKSKRSNSRSSKRSNSRGGSKRSKSRSSKKSKSGGSNSRSSKRSNSRSSKRSNSRGGSKSRSSKRSKSRSQRGGNFFTNLFGKGETTTPIPVTTTPPPTTAAAIAAAKNLGNKAVDSAKQFGSSFVENSKKLGASLATDAREVIPAIHKDIENNFQLHESFSMAGGRRMRNSRNQRGGDDLASQAGTVGSGSDIPIPGAVPFGISASVPAGAQDQMYGDGMTRMKGARDIVMPGTGALGGEAIQAQLGMMDGGKRSKKSRSYRSRGGDGDSGGVGSDFAMVLASRGPANYPDGPSADRFRIFNKTGDFIPNSMLKFAAAPILTGYQKDPNPYPAAYNSYVGGKKRSSSKKSKRSSRK